MQLSRNALNEGGAIERDHGLEPISFRYIFSVLRRWRMMLIATICAALVAALIYLALAPVRYTATATIVLDTRRLPFFAQKETVVEQQEDEGVVESHMEMIKSANVAAIVVKKLKLSEDPEFTDPSYLEKWLSNWTADDSADPREKKLGLAIQRYEKGLRVNRTSPHSYVVEIAYTSLDPQEAANIANATAEAYIEDQLQAKFEAGDRAGEWLQKRIAELRTQATEAFKNIQDFKSQNNLIVSGDGTLATDLELQRLTESLAKARAETALAESRLADIEAVLAAGRGEDELPDATITDALHSAVITKLRQQYLDDKKRAIDWASRYGQNHQSVVNLQSDMASLKREIREETQRIAETYKSDVQVARSHEKTIEKRLTEVFQNNSANRQSQVKLQDLETAANSYRSTYENFLNHYTQEVQQQSFPSTEARVITAATPGGKTSPKITLTLALAIVAGAGLGAAAAFIREQFDRSVYARDQLVRELGVNCICALPGPERSKDAPLVALPPKVSRLSIAVGLTQALTKQDAAGSPALLYSARDPFSATSEALRAIKVSMDLREARTLGIVSALPGEGKSSVAISLAATIAEADRKVLLIDGDLRNPTLTKFFGFRSGAGVLEVLYGTENLADITHHNGQFRFDFLCGPTKVRPVHTADLLGSGAMRKLLADATKSYHYVVVDLPPILPVIDVRACSHMFDSFALVVEWGRTAIDDLEKAFRISPLVHDRLLGVVLNKVDTDAMLRIEGSGYPAYGHYVDARSA